MSWFQTTNIASLAKTALKEAQRTIDKALEIGDSSAPTVSSSATIHTITEAPEKADATEVLIPVNTKRIVEEEEFINQDSYYNVFLGPLSETADDSQLDSSSKTVLFEQSSHESADDDVGNNDDDDGRGNDDKMFKTSSPPASCASALDSPRSPSPLVSNNEHSEEENQDNNFELLSHSKLDCHSGRDFLPESSRSSSIVVVSSSARASSGGSGSTASTGSDNNMNRDIDLVESNIVHLPYDQHRHSQQNESGSEGSTGYERVDLPTSAHSSDPTSPEFTKLSATCHRKGPSSASSSDIEVILSSDLHRHNQDDEFSNTITNPITIGTSSSHFQEYQSKGTQTSSDDSNPPNKYQEEGAAVKESSENSDSIIGEKDQIIDQLRKEGEKLSQKQFDLGQVIKKLRAKEKETENSVKRLTGELAGKNVENERLMKSFVNLKSTELTLNENVQKLTSEKRALELENLNIKSELEDAKENCASMKSSVEDASVEVLELKNAISSAQRESAELDNLTREKSDLISKNDSLQKEIDNLRCAINSHQDQSSTRETEQRHQIAALTRQVHELESQIADFSTEAADATMPLSNYIEKLQSELHQSQISSEKREKLLNSQMIHLESKWKNSADKELTLKDHISNLESTITTLENKLQELEATNLGLKREVSLLEENEQKATQEHCQKTSNLEIQIRKLTTEIGSINQENQQLAFELKSESASLEQERKRNQTLLEQLSSSGKNTNQTQHHKTSTVSNANNGNFATKSGENSPGCNSVTSENSYLDEVFDPYSQLGGHREMTPRSFFDSYSTSTTGLLEHLQSQLRQREAEGLQFQEEIRKNEKIRKSLNDEIAKLTMRNHEFHLETERLSELQPKLDELEKNYNALLQLYGEKVEETEELRLDLQDVKDMYKNQIEQLLKR